MFHMQFISNLRNVFVGSTSSRKYYHTLKSTDFGKVKNAIIIFYLFVIIYSSSMFSRNILLPMQSIFSELPQKLEESIPKDFSAQWNGSMLSFSEPIMIEVKDQRIGQLLSQPSDVLLIISSDAQKDIDVRKSFFTITGTTLFTRYSDEFVQETPLSEFLGQESSSISKQTIMEEATALSESSGPLVFMLQILSVPVISIWFVASRGLFVIISIFLAKYLLQLGEVFPLKRLGAIHLSLLIPAELIQQVAIANSEYSLPYFALAFWLFTLFIYFPLIKMTVQKL